MFGFSIQTNNYVEGKAFSYSYIYILKMLKIKIIKEIERYEILWWLQ